MQGIPENTNVGEVVVMPLLEVKKNIWYSDPRDPRCPHDAWLSQCDFTIKGMSDDESECEKTLHLVLLNAYHNGFIAFTYERVRAYDIELRKKEERGKIWRRSDWLEDTAEALAETRIRHQISWESQTWTIEAEQITYQWMPSRPAS